MRTPEWVGNNRNAVAFVRKSTKKQRDHSFDNQVKMIKKHCQRYNLNLIKVFEITESAKRSKFRKIYKAALREADKLNARHHAYGYYDRESRNMTDSETNEQRVLDDEIVLHYVSENKVLYCDSPDSDFFIRDINTATAKDVSRRIGSKVKDGMRSKAETGWYPGNQPPLGYATFKPKDERGNIIKSALATIISDPIESNIKWIQREFELRAKDGLTLRAIRNKVIEENLVPLKKLKSYSATTVEKRLKNDFYAGYFMWAGLRYKGQHKLIISSEVFNAVQASFGKKAQFKKKNGLFSGGWIKCAECGCQIVFDPKKRYRKTLGVTRVYNYYRCSNGKKVHKKQDNVSEAKIFEQFEKVIEEISISDDFAKELSEAINQCKSKAQNATHKQIGDFQKTLKELEAEEDIIYQDYRKGILDEQGYQRQIKLIREQRDYSTKQMKQVQLNLSDAICETAQSIIELSNNAKLLWKEQTPEERKDMLNRILSNPLLDGVTVRYETKKPFKILSKMKGYLNWYSQGEITTL